MFPKWKYLPSWKEFRQMDSAYWLTFVTVISTFVAGIIGFVVFWLNYFVIDIGVSPTIFNGYLAWMGGASAMLGYTVGAHSHAIVMALILGVVAVVAKRFSVLSLAGWKRTMAKVGLWVSITGVLAFTVVFFLEAFTTVFPGGAPDLIFASNPGGPFQLYSSTALNGWAGDDSTMLWASIGAMIVLVPLFYTNVRGRPAWRDPVRSAILLTWIFSFIATPIQGFYIEQNEATLKGMPPDVVFGALQYFALIGITLVCMSLLAVDFYTDRKEARSPMAAFAILSVLLATVGAYIYAFFTTNSGSSGYWIFNVGFVLMSVVILAAMVAVFQGHAEKIPSEGVLPGSAKESEPPAAREAEKAPS